MKHVVYSTCGQSLCEHRKNFFSAISKIVDCLNVDKIKNAVITITHNPTRGHFEFWGKKKGEGRERMAAIKILDVCQPF